MLRGHVRAFATSRHAGKLGGDPATIGIDRLAGSLSPSSCVERSRNWETESMANMPPGVAAAALKDTDR